MKKLIVLFIIIGASFTKVAAQAADPFLNILMEPGSLEANNTGQLDITANNTGDDDIVANSLSIVIHTSSNSEITGLNPAGSDARWTITHMTTGNGNTVELRNTGGTIPGFDGGDVFLVVKASVISSSADITGDISYIPGPNPLIGNAPSSSQGDIDMGNDHSTTSLAVTGGALPLQLLSFTGTTSNCDALLHWTVAVTPGDMPDHFEIQAAADGINFHNVGIIATANHSTTYDFTYAQPDATTYYRLRMVEVNGSATFSNSITLHTNCNGGTHGPVKVWPNPTQGNITVTGILATDHIDIYDLNGAIVQRKVATGDNEQLNITPLAAGTYYIVVTGSTQLRQLLLKE